LLVYLLCMIWPAFAPNNLTTVTPAVAWSTSIGMAALIASFAIHRIRRGKKGVRKRCQVPFPPAFIVRRPQVSTTASPTVNSFRGLGKNRGPQRRRSGLRRCGFYRAKTTSLNPRVTHGRFVPRAWQEPRTVKAAVRATPLRGFWYSPLEESIAGALQEVFPSPHQSPMAG